jgi:capsular exopolysaccharide synthesis family protein
LEKQNFLKTQESLLVSYQNVYTSLLSTEEVKRTTNEIDNLQQNLVLYQNVYLNLLSSRENVKREKLQNIPTIEQISLSQASKDPVKPRTLLNTLLGGFSGLILAFGFVLLRENTDDTLKSSEEAEQILGAKVIGYIANFKKKEYGQGIYVGRAPRSPVAEAFRAVRTDLEFSAKEGPVKKIIVTSGGASEGKTTIACNLAAILAHSNKNVILVDADLRRPRVHQYTDISNTVGLGDLLSSEEICLNDCVQKFEGVSHLSILPSGSLPSNPTDLLASEKMKNILKMLSTTYDYVVLDCPPMIVADPEVLLGLADGLLLVIIPGRTSKEAVRAVKEQVQRTGVRLLGVVFNRLQSRHRVGYRGYSYYSYPYFYASDYYSSSDGDGSRKNKVLWKRRSKKS